MCPNATPTQYRLAETKFKEVIRISPLSLILRRFNKSSKEAYRKLNTLTTNSMKSGIMTAVKKSVILHKQNTKETIAVKESLYVIKQT